MMTNQTTMDEHFLQEAVRFGARSKDPRKKIGAIIVRPDNSVVSRGYNGFPEGIADTPERYLDRTFKSAVMIHAEENAIRLARGENLSDCTIYVSEYQPCAHCAAWLVSAGISRVVTNMAEFSPKWKENFEIAVGVFEEAGISFETLPCSDTSPKG